MALAVYAYVFAVGQVSNNAKHMQTMRENMMLAGGMADGCPMMGSGMGMMMGPGAGMMMGSGDMMQMMLEQQGKPPTK